MKPMQWAVLALLPLAIAPAPAYAGKNADGALIVHTTGVMGYRYWGCEWRYDDPGSCENAGTQLAPDVDYSRVIWLLAAFPDGAEPGVSSISFGVMHNYPPDEGWIYQWWFCGPEGTIQDAEPGFPESWRTAGNRVTFGEPVLGDRLFPFYWVAAYGEEGHLFGTGPHPNSNRPTGFYDDSPEPAFDDCSLFGAVGWGEPGFNDCPGTSPAKAACCLDGGYCLLVDPDFCTRFGGEPLPGLPYCDPNPCLLVDVPEEPRIRSTWGRVKTFYR